MDCSILIWISWRSSGWFYGWSHGRRTKERTDIIGLVPGIWFLCPLHLIRAFIVFKLISCHYAFLKIFWPIVSLKVSTSNPRLRRKPLQTLDSGIPLMDTRQKTRTSKVKGIDISQNIQKLCDMCTMEGSKLKNWLPNTVDTVDSGRNTRVTNAMVSMELLSACMIRLPSCVTRWKDFGQDNVY